MASWIYNPIKDAESFQSNTGLLPGIPVKQQTNTGLEPPAPKVDTSKKLDGPSFLDEVELFTLILMITIGVVWWYFRKRG